MGRLEPWPVGHGLPDWALWAAVAFARCRALALRRRGPRFAWAVRMTIVMLDPGHGGRDRAEDSTPHGVRGPRGTLEKDVNLALARIVQRELGGLAELTRDGDYNLSLEQRADH